MLKQIRIFTRLVKISIQLKHKVLMILPISSFRRDLNLYKRILLIQDQIFLQSLSYL